MQELLIQRPQLPLGIVLAAALLAASVSAFAPLVGVMIVAAALLLLVGSLSRSLVLSIVIMSGTTDLLTTFNVGPVSTMGMLTILYAGGSWAVWVLRAQATPRETKALAPMLLLLALGTLSMFLWYAPSVAASQNLIVIAAFLGLAFLTAVNTRTGAADAAMMTRAFGVASVLAPVLYLATRFLPNGIGGTGVGARAFALFALMSLAWFIAGWRTGAPWGLWVAIALVALLGFSLSRTAFVVALALFPLAQMRLRSVMGWVRLTVYGFLAILLLYASISLIEPLRSRFFEGDTSLEIAGVGINTEGRTAAWEVVLDSYQEAPLMGKGVGSSQAVIEEFFPWLNHPHNDYLRILHDYGLVGMALWAFGYIWLLQLTWRAWQRADQAADATGRVHLAAFLALMAVALAMITDNVVVYIYVMAPLGVLVGASLGLMKDGQQCESST